MRAAALEAVGAAGMPAVRLRRWGLPQWSSVVGALLLGTLIVLALAPQRLARYDPHAIAGAPLERPNASFLLGTNDIGQDLASELLWGTRVSLGTGLFVAALAVAGGTAAGVLSGAVRGVLGQVLMRLADLTLVLPFLPLVILLSAYLGPGQRNVVLVLALVSWAGPARLIRSRVLRLMSEPFIEASRALGSRKSDILLRHVLPGIRSLALVEFVLVANTSILAEASLSFLGLGDPSGKSWGSMLYFARASGAFLGDAWLWWVLPAGAMITLTVLSLALIGFGLEERFEPGLRT